MRYIFLWIGVIFTFSLLPQNFASAAYPDVASVTETTFTTDVTDHAISLPETVVAGDLLLIIFTNDGNATVTKPVGWRTLWDESTGSALRASGYAKVAIGDEGSTTVNFITSSAEQAAAQVYRIQNWYGTLDGIAVGSEVVSTSGTTANPPSLSPGWGVADTLWIPIIHTSTARTIVSGSDGYSNLINTRSGETTTAGQIGSMRLNTNTATEDPGVFTFSSTGVTSVAQTIAIAPAGVSPTKFFERLDVTQPGTSTELFVPIYTNQFYQTPDSDIKRAVIVIHGSNNNADDYFDYVSDSIGDTAGVIILAPQFAEAENNPDVDQLFWSSGWRQCNRSDDSLPWRVPSCEVIDQLIDSLYSTFPNLDSVVISGFSAGGQFVNRYAAASDDSRNRYIVGAPSSYLYLSDVRPDGLGGFSVPVTASSCPTYNDYKFGLNNLSVTNYMDLVGSSELINRYGQARITYIIGSNDTDPLDSSMDQDCESELQGAYRVSRMQNFYDYLELIYAADVYNRHKMEIVDGYAHESQYIFGSTQGRNAFLEGFNFTLDFDTQGGSSVSDDTVASGATTTLPTAPTRSGYTFQNWNTLANGSGTSYTAGATFTMPSSNTILYAIWSAVIVIPDNYNLSFNTRGGSSAPSATVAEGATTTLPTTPTRSGYTFQNWNTLANGSGTSYTAGASFTMPSNDTTLYAIWSTVASSGGSGGGGGGGSKSKYQSNSSSTTIQYKDLKLTQTLIEIIAKYRDQLIYAHSLGIALPQIITDLLTSSTTNASYFISNPQTQRDLTINMFGEDVQVLQTFLIKQGYIIPDGATGYFGSQTQSALASYQSKNNIIPASGYFGPITREYIKRSEMLGV